MYRFMLCMTWISWLDAELGLDVSVPVPPLLPFLWQHFLCVAYLLHRPLSSRRRPNYAEQASATDAAP